jgi:hypothetical protein
MPVRFLLSPIAMAAALALAPAALAQPAAPVVAPIYPGPDGTPHYLLGVSASGATQDLDRLAAAATALGWPVARDLDASGKVSLVIGFKGANPAQVDAFLKRAGAGEYGRFTFESTMAPVKP